MRGPTVFTKLNQEEEIEIGLQRWQFDALLLLATSRRQEVETQIRRALSGAEESVWNQQALVMDAIISDLGSQLDHEIKTVTATTRPGVSLVPAEVDSSVLSDALTGVDVFKPETVDTIKMPDADLDVQPNEEVPAGVGG